jgi:hypothetical protein
MSEQPRNGNGLARFLAANPSFVLTLAMIILGAAVVWGQVRAQLDQKLDCAKAAETYVTKADLAEQLARIEARQERIEQKIDQLLLRSR